MPLSPEGALIQGAGSGVWGAMYYGIIPVGGASLAELLALADSWYSSKDGAEVVQMRGNRINEGWAEFGSLGGADITQWGLTLEGATNNYATTPDAAALRITGDIDIRIRLSNMAPSVTSTLISKDNVSTNRSYALESVPSGDCVFRWSTDGAGTGELSQTSTSAAASTAGWIRVTMDVDNGAGGYDLKFYTSTDVDSPSWTQLGTTIVGGSTTSIFSGTAALEIGRRGNSSRYYPGIVRSAEVRDGIDGTIVASPDFVAATDYSTSFDDDQANTWAISGGGVDTNDPTRLVHDGTDYVWFPESIDNEVNSDSTVAQTFGVGWYVKVLLHSDDLAATPSGNSVIVSDNFGIPGWQLATTGADRIIGYYRDGNGTNFEQSSVTIASLNLPADTKIWLKMTLQTTTTMRFEYSDDNEDTWTTIGADQTLTAIDESATRTATITIGSRATDEAYPGKVYWAESPDFIFDPSDLTGWTVGRSATGLKTAVVTRSVDMFDGVDDYFQLPTQSFGLDPAASESGTFIVMFNRQEAPTVNERLLAMGGTSGTDTTGPMLNLNSTGFRAGGRNAALTTWIDFTNNIISDWSQTQVVAGVYDADAGLGYSYVYGNGFAAGTAWALDLTPDGPCRVGVDPQGGSNALKGGEVFEVVTFPGVALTEEELDAIAAKMIAGTYT